MVLQSICGGFDNIGWDPVQAMRRDRRVYLYICGTSPALLLTLCSFTTAYYISHFAFYNIK